jgi:hypothetical protein
VNKERNRRNGQTYDWIVVARGKEGDIVLSCRAR